MGTDVVAGIGAAFAAFGIQSTGREPPLQCLFDVVWVAGPLLSGVLYVAV